MILALGLCLGSGLDGTLCKRQSLCNGVMCMDTCVPGSVDLDPWVGGALAFQRELQRFEPLARATLIGTHNSAISQAYGFGIEQDYLSKLLPKRQFYAGDDLGEGVCQSLSVLDQLRLGLRHIEIDINSGYYTANLTRLNEIHVCHSPVPLDVALVAEVDVALDRAGIVDGWHAEQLSCLGTNIPFRDMLLEVRGWLDANPSEVAVLYLDVKPECVSLPSQASSAYADMVAALGADRILRVKDAGAGGPLSFSRDELLQKGIRVVFEDHDDGWKTPAHGEDVLVFTPDLWNHQFSAQSLVPFPNCSIEGEPFASWYTPVAARADPSLTKPYVRGLGWGRTTMGDDVAGAMKCGVNILSSNYIAPADLEGYVWFTNRSAWSPPTGGGAGSGAGAGAGAAGGSCMAMLPSGEWALAPADQPCGSNKPAACRTASDDTAWLLGNDPARPGGCSADHVAAAPTNGYANEMLKRAAKGQLVWLPVAADGSRLANAENA